MEKIFVSPGKYVQGKNALETGLHHLTVLGQRALLLCDAFVYRLAGEKLQKALENQGLFVLLVFFHGESSVHEIQRVSQLGAENYCDLVIGLGGGKTLDVAKGISDQLEVSVAILPTTASTDAPTSRISVMYSDEGVFEKYVFYKKNPELVLVDTQLICQAPAKLLAGGIADALATWVEGRSIIQHAGKMLIGGLPTLAAQAIAQKCEEILFENGLKAMVANEAKVVTAAFEAVVEANTLLSGLGFESCGLSIAHGIHNGFSTLQGDIHTLSHGEKVAYGTLTQLMIENAPREELNRYIQFYQELGLPTTLEEMQLSKTSKEELFQIGVVATNENQSSQQMGRVFTAEEVVAGLLAVDRYVKVLS
ncbi:glycerol dehydrogenase [Enterococcus sp. LJL98]